MTDNGGLSAKDTMPVTVDAVTTKTAHFPVSVLVNDNRNVNNNDICTLYEPERKNITLRISFNKLHPHS